VPNYLHKLFATHVNTNFCIELIVDFTHVIMHNVKRRVASVRRP